MDIAHPGGEDSFRPADAGHPEVAADLRRRILDGEFGPVGRLPSEAALAREYGTTRAKVRTALVRLARQSLLESRPREGWHVRAGHRTQGFDRMLSFAQWASAGGLEAGGLITGRARRPADAREARVLGIRLGEPLPTFTRVRTLGGRAVMVERSTWAPWLSALIDAMPDDVSSTTAALAEAGIHVASGTHRIEAVPASTEDAALLGVRRSAPLLQVTRITTARDDRTVELGVDRYQADVIAFEVEAGESTRTLA
ncbi:GntR family transcriptional regulator [Planctomonas sp. JC2975]|uniref:UTRA domain-containing protein n=1 Tax=Planctomonas sp. JC2975 TaxID=2729626 RepID=UPI00147502DA|nr:GntR family transcriptional regulator [Planctomonas sp. JC2975]